MQTKPDIAPGLYPWLRATYDQLTTQFTEGRLHHAMLIQGVKGLGKSQLSVRLAQFLQCATPQSNKACGQCKSCLLHRANTHPDCYSVAPLGEKTSISVEQIRKVQASIVTTGLTNPIRVVLIPDADLMTTSATNALLKVLEEPPQDVFFILTCPQRALLMPTIVSRCLDINVANVAKEKLAAWVNKQVAIDFSTAQFALFNYSPLLALSGINSGMLDFVAALRQSVLEIILDQGRANAPILPLVQLLKEQTKDQKITIDQTIDLIYLLIIDCTKFASGLTCSNSFELTQPQIAKIHEMDVKDFLALEQDLNQLKQLIIEQPSINKLLQLQRVIVNFAPGS